MGCHPWHYSVPSFNVGKARWIFWKHLRARMFPIPISSIAGRRAGTKESRKQRATELGSADRVRFLGFVNQSQLPASYSAADLFVLPSLFEPFGLVVNEAMLCGLPVAVSDRVWRKI